jgi:transglutaminase-like putative cysteine protease
MARTHCRLVFGAVVVALLAALAAAGRAQPAASAPEPTPYTAAEVWSTPADAFFRLVEHPQTGRCKGAAQLALIQKATEDDGAREYILQTAAQIAKNLDNSPLLRSACCHVLGGVGDERAIPVLALVLSDDRTPLMRIAAATSLGEFSGPSARTALQQALARETNPYARSWIERSLTRLSNAEHLTERWVSMSLVGDWMRVSNAGPEVRQVEFARYSPAVDEEQIVLGRWVTGCDSAGADVPVSIVRAEPDARGNVVQTLRLDRCPATSDTVVRVLSVVARHEKPAPHGPYPILSAEAYPAEVRPFLAASRTFPRDNAEVQAQATALLAQTHDALTVTRRLCALMATKRYSSVYDEEVHQSTAPVAALALRYGWSCCGSANCVVSVLRACGIPAEMTYVPRGAIHGIAQAYLSGYGWLRVESTSGVAKVPKPAYGAPRLFDLPAEWERIQNCWAWPYNACSPTGPYTFLAGDQACRQLRFTVKRGAGTGGVAKFTKPFSHDESGNDHVLLGSEPFAGAWLAWDDLAKASRAAVLDRTMGEFTAVSARAPTARQWIARGLTYQEPEQSATAPQ